MKTEAEIMALVAEFAAWRAAVAREGGSSDKLDAARESLRSAIAEVVADAQRLASALDGVLTWGIDTNYDKADAAVSVARAALAAARTAGAPNA